MDDLISRQAAIDFVGSMNMCDEISNEAYKKLTSYFEELPSAQPERKKGKWIRDKKTEKEEQLMFHKVWMCSRCGEQQYRPKPSNFCPNCGADMRGED